METLAVGTDSLHPAAAAGKRLLVGQVEHQAEEWRLPPLQEVKPWRVTHMTLVKFFLLLWRSK